jgi:hypothetical protein
MRLSNPAQQRRHAEIVDSLSSADRAKIAPYRAR